MSELLTTKIMYIYDDGTVKVEPAPTSLYMLARSGASVTMQQLTELITLTMEDTSNHPLHLKFVGAVHKVAANRGITPGSIYSKIKVNMGISTKQLLIYIDDFMYYQSTSLRHLLLNSFIDKNKISDRLLVEYTMQHLKELSNQYYLGN